MARAALVVVEAALMLVAAIVAGEVALMMEAATMVGAAIVVVEVLTMGEGIIMAGAVIIGEGLGMGAVSGLAQDGGGADGVRGGVLRSILTMRNHPLSSSNSLRYTSSQPLRKRRRVTGITAGIPRATILT
jgi:hypothetical protein